MVRIGASVNLEPVPSAVVRLSICVYRGAQCLAVHNAARNALCSATITVHKFSPAKLTGPVVYD